MLTTIGKFLRKLRIDNGEILHTMAVKLDVSSAFLSAVENGKKKMPDAWQEKLAILYALSEEQKRELHAAVINTNETVELNLQNMPLSNRELAICFARQFGSLDEDTSKKIMEMLENSRRNET